MQIGSTVPNMIGTAALQFTAYLAQTALEASIRRRKNKGNSQEYLPQIHFLFRSNAIKKHALEMFLVHHGWYNLGHISE